MWVREKEKGKWQLPNIPCFPIEERQVMVGQTKRNLLRQDRENPKGHRGADSDGSI